MHAEESKAALYVCKLSGKNVMIVIQIGQTTISDKVKIQNVAGFNCRVLGKYP